jgi:hypothetical protein
MTMTMAATQSERGNEPRPHEAKRQSKRTKRSYQCDSGWAAARKSHLAHTLDVSNHGVRVGGFRGELTAGDRIEIQYRQKRAHFRCFGYRALKGTSEKQFWAECLESGRQVWGAEIPELTDEYLEEV